MKNEWQNAVINKISIAVYVPPNRGKSVHKNRPFHGLVLNCAGAEKEYHFSDGFVLQVKEWELFYLPKGTSYEVKSISHGGCYAINFDADICGEPFALKIQSYEQIRKSFKIASDEWRRSGIAKNAYAMGALYEAFALILKEGESRYIPNARYRLIEPAIEAIDKGLADRELTTAHLAQLCGISEVYLRRLFVQKLGASPKEYIIKKRIEYAKQMLRSGQFEVSEVALLSGYSEPCHFSREFKRRVGVSPAEYI